MFSNNKDLTIEIVLSLDLEISCTEMADNQYTITEKTIAALGEKILELLGVKELSAQYTNLQHDIICFFISKKLMKEMDILVVPPHKFTPNKATWGKDVLALIQQSHDLISKIEDEFIKKEAKVHFFGNLLVSGVLDIEDISQKILANITSLTQAILGSSIKKYCYDALLGNKTAKNTTKDFLDSYQELSYMQERERIEKIQTQQVTIAELKKTIAAKDETIAEQATAIAAKDETMVELKKTIAALQQESQQPERSSSPARNRPK